MALKKELIFDNGVKIEYHMINDVKVDNTNKVVKLKVASYTNKTYRDQEITNKTNKDRYNQLLNLIFQENEKTEEERNIEQIIEWSEESNNIANSFKDDLDLKVTITDIELKNVTDYNMSNLYDLVKQEELFIDSEDI